MVDVSFISLTKVLPSVLESAAGEFDCLAMVKPQFEVGRARVGKGGVVRDEVARQGALAKVRDFAAGAGFTVGRAIDSPIRGPAGNLEMLLELGAPPRP